MVIGHITVQLFEENFKNVNKLKYQRNLANSNET